MSSSGETIRVRAARSSANALVVAGMMIIGGLALWIGVPAGWLWVGSQIQAADGSLTTAIMVMFAGTVVSVIALARVLAWLGHWHETLREAAGRPKREYTLLEVVLVVTAGLALVGFGVWFFIFTGPGPSIAPSN